MISRVVPVSVKGVMPTVNGCAVFLGNEDKAYVIYVDHSVGNAISMALNSVKKERPLTHDLMSSMLKGLDAKITRILINDCLLYTSPSPRDKRQSRMPSSA